MTNGVREKPNGSTGEFARLQPTPAAALQDPEDDQREAERGQGCTDEIELWAAALVRSVTDPADETKDHNDDDNLAGEDQPPGEICGDPPAEERAYRDACAGQSADHAVGDGTVPPPVVSTDQRCESG
jgi:hypothetical protein